MATVLIDHFWMFGMLVSWVNLAVGRYRMRRLIHAGGLTAQGANRFCMRAAVALALVCGALEVSRVAVGTTLSCQMSLPLTHPAVWALYVPVLVAGGAFLVWIWALGGDRTLAVVGPAFTRGSTMSKNYTPRQVRLSVAALIVIAWGGHFAVRAAGPTRAAAHGCADPVQEVH